MHAHFAGGLACHLVPFTFPIKCILVGLSYLSNLVKILNTMDMPVKVLIIVRLSMGFAFDKYQYIMYMGSSLEIVL